MGMFDSLYDEYGIEWQTKAFDRTLAQYNILDVIYSGLIYPFQVEVLGGSVKEGFILSHATIFNGVLAEVDVPRDPLLPFINYSGYPVPTANGEKP